jgi:hypothetical protein
MVSPECFDVPKLYPSGFPGVRQGDTLFQFETLVHGILVHFVTN